MVLSNKQIAKELIRLHRLVCAFVASRPNSYGECFSNISENNVPLLLEALCSNEMSAKEHLEKQQALVKQLAEVLDFVLKFDDLKVGCL